MKVLLDSNIKIYQTKEVDVKTQGLRANVKDFTPSSE